MSSSSASSLARGADIIDLDRYMRCNVRPSNPRHTRDRLVVDAGGVGVVGAVGAGVGSGSGSDSARSVSRDKRYWHDSGLSDGSCIKPRSKPRRQESEGGTGSVRAFRAACERALRDQQQQLARVTQLCELLLQTPGETHAKPRDGENPAQPSQRETHAQPLDGETSVQVSKKNFGQNVSPRSVPRRRRACSRSSDASSSSSRRAHRSESCRTYEIIVSKLDELSHLFAARRTAALSTAPAACSAGSPAAVAPPATPQVKLDATEKPDCVLQAAHVRRARGERCVVARAHELNIAPGGVSSGDASSVRRWSGPTRCELEDGVRPHAPQASTQRADEQHGASLCALCRGSWRRLTRRLFGTCS